VDLVLTKGQYVLLVVVRWHMCQRASKDIFASETDFDCWKTELAKTDIRGMKEYWCKSKKKHRREADSADNLHVSL